MDRWIGNPGEEQLGSVFFQLQGKDAEDGAPNGRKIISPASAGQRDRSSRLPGIDGDDYLVIKLFKEDSKKELLGSGDTSTDSSLSTHGFPPGAQLLYLGPAPVVPTCDWSDKFSDPIPQRDNTCTISACIMCIDAVHRIAYEKTHGAGSFGYKVDASVVKELKGKIGRSGAYPDEVLELIRLNKGLPTVENIISLTCKYETYYTPTAEKTLELLTHGPVVGGFGYGAGYKDIRGDLVYEGAKVEEHATPHAVVCVSHKFEGDKLLIKIIDNQELLGPVRWVNHKAFQLFTVIEVDQVYNKKS